MHPMLFSWTFQGGAGKGDALTAYCLDALEKALPKIEDEVMYFIFIVRGLVIYGRKGWKG